MSEISFNDIASFCKFVDQQKKRKVKGFSPAVLMSFDMERALMIKAPTQLYEDEYGRKSFRGVPILFIVADGYLSFIWEANEE